MIVRINGKESEVPQKLTIADIVRERNLPDRVIIDLNGEILNPERWSSTYLRSDDDLELVQVIGGG
ncbi:MAG: sulfur carrier protein ThiS [Chloroflexi bacterium]|nr:sulfur carrier protein ThiS [Chloroflexota bacterium]